jgi:ketosteroid isomerase-like protein
MTTDQRVPRRAALALAGGAALSAALVPAPASAHAGGQRQRSIATADALYRALTAKDLDAFAAVWAPDAISRMPLTPPGEIHGRDGIVEGIGFFFMVVGEVTMTWQVRPLLDPHEVVSTWTMEAPLLAGGVYRNRGAQIMRIHGDQIVDNTEFLDTAAFLEAFGQH